MKNSLLFILLLHQIFVFSQKKDSITAGSIDFGLGISKGFFKVIILQINLIGQKLVILLILVSIPVKISILDYFFLKITTKPFQPNILEM